MNDTSIQVLSYAMQFLLIALALAIVLNKNNGTIIIFIATFSLVTASLYILNNAPDVAIAEVAIGSAIIPLIYIISISRQREYIVLDRVNDEFIYVDGELQGEGYLILQELATYYKLTLNFTNDIIGDDRILFEQGNIDLIVARDERTGKYIFRGKQSNIIMTRLEKMIKDHPRIVLEKYKDGEVDG